MASFLKFISGLYLVIVWLAFAIVAAGSNGQTQIFGLVALLSAIGASIPAAALYAFGQVVEDVRQSRDHLAAMRKYYEPSQVARHVA